MKAHRQDVYYAAMDMNNFVESYHLKSHFLKRQFIIHVDRTVYLLSDVVNHLNRNSKPMYA